MGYTDEELEKSLQVIASVIKNCEKMLLKFKEGTSQHSLLRNRIKALNISQCLISNNGNIKKITNEELLQAIPPVVSIIHKTKKAQIKYD